MAFQPHSIQQAQQGMNAYAQCDSRMGMGMLFPDMASFPAIPLDNSFQTVPSMGLPSSLDDDDMGIGTSIDCLEHILNMGNCHSLS